MSLIPVPQTINFNTYNGLYPSTVGSWYSATPSLTIATAPATTILSFTVQVASVNLSNPTGSAIHIVDTGLYKLLYSLQFIQGAGNDVVNVWIVVNGTAVPYSNSYQSMKNGDKQNLTVEFYLPFVAGDRVELYSSSTGVNANIVTLPASGPIPASPAVVINIIRVA